MNRYFLLFFIWCAAFAKASAQRIIISTHDVSLVYEVDAAKKQLNQLYLGKRLTDTAAYRQISTAKDPAFATGGAIYDNEPAIQVKHADGNMSLQLQYQSVERKADDNNIIVTHIKLKDPAYPFYLTLHYKAFQKENVIETWTTINHTEGQEVILNKYASVFLNFYNPQNYVTHFYGDWAVEAQADELLLPVGIYSLQSKLGTMAARRELPGFLLSPTKLPAENEGEVFGGSLAWSGNFDMMFETLHKNRGVGNSMKLICGINSYASAYHLKSGEVFDTPHFIFTYSAKGKGQVSRNFHNWAINHGIWNGKQTRHTLLNNWETTEFHFTQDTLVKLFDGAKQLGVDLFLLDDGWFGNKYSRNNDHAGLGDWQPNVKKLPDGVSYLVKEADKRGVKFGIWIEPEMVNPQSELYEQHPDWVLKAPNRPEDHQRNQLILDLANPKVQDHVFAVVDNLMKNAPGLAYMKWDCNRFMTNPYSMFLGKHQEALYVHYTKGLYKVLDRVRAKYPNLELMLCSSGGARAEYGAMKYFQEFWASDNTNQLDRIKIQWGLSHFFPALTICSHVTEAGNQSLKFKLDVAMWGKAGFDLQVSKLSAADVAFSKSVIDNYKRLQPVINYGELYRLVSPYQTNSAALMYVNDAKSKAVVYTYNLVTTVADFYPTLKLDGLDAAKKYRVTEINLKAGTKPSFTESGKTFSGETLMYQGIKWFLKGSEKSAVLELEAL